VRALWRAYTGLVNALAAIAAAMLAVMTALIVVDVLMRNFGFQPYPHTIALTEYSLLYIAMLGGPWLVREKGHVHIELVVQRLHGRARRILHLFVSAACVVACAVLAWYSLDVTIGSIARHDMDIRSFDSPRWILTACMPLGFALMTVEFARFLLGHDDMFQGAAIYE
jgi:TRAP-type C4-dicarboxylate transport system permease small subunit